ncbi:MAG: metallophosphoesterase family protein [Rubrimonas sp.]
MRRILHLSDLHFGRLRDGLAEPLLDAVTRARPDLVAISGDLTQRATPEQFRAARAFVDRIAAPVVMVPGNHDAPLGAVFERIFAPWRRWRRWLGDDLEPVWRDGLLDVVGLNTADPWRWQSGRFPRDACARLATLTGGRPDPRRLRVVVAHHPLIQRPEDPKAPTRGGGAGLAGLARVGADLVLTGHLHRWRAETAEGVVLCAAGSSLSTRLRGEDNDFNLLEVSPSRIRIVRHGAPSGSPAYAPAGEASFVRDGAGWRAA